jgi:hypothetical protein
MTTLNKIIETLKKVSAVPNYFGKNKIDIIIKADA